MLGLAEQVGGHEVRVGGLVGDHEDLRRPREQVDPDPPEELALGLGDVRVAGADDHVDRLEPAEAERHRCERLDAAEAEDPVRARGGHRVQHGGWMPRPSRGGALATTRSTPATFGTDDGHERGREHRVAAARHVRADRADRHVAVASRTPGSVSTSRSESVSSWRSAKSRTRA